MSFKKDMRIFMEEVREFMTFMRKHAATVALHKELIARLEKQNKDLMDRFMARNFEELRTYQTSVEMSVPKELYKPEEDESLAGEVVDFE